MNTKSNTIEHISPGRYHQLKLRHMHLIIPALVFLVFTLSSCVKKQIIVDKRLLTSVAENSRQLLEKIRTINNQSPEHYSATFTTVGSLNKKKITAIGKIFHIKKSNQTKIELLDAVFKSPITTLVQDGGIIKIHFPVDKTLYIDNASTLNLKKYTPFDLNYVLFQPFISGQIPLIQDFTIKKEFAELKEDDLKKIRRFLILENTEYFQTISFKNMIPEMVLFISKNTMKKYELYLEKPIIDNNMVFYRKIKFVAVDTGDKLTFTINKPDFVKPVSSRKILYMNIRRNTRTIRMDKKI